MISEFVQEYNKRIYVHMYMYAKRRSNIERTNCYNRMSFAQRANASLYFSTVGSFDCRRLERAVMSASRAFIPSFCSMRMATRR